MHSTWESTAAERLCSATARCSDAGVALHRIMHSSDRTVLRNFLALGLGEAISRLIAFGVTVYLARQLGVGLFGTLGFASAIMLYLVPIADGGLDTGTGVRTVAANPDAIDEIAPALMTARLFRGILFVLISATLSLLLLPKLEGAVVAVSTMGLVAVAGGPRWIMFGLDRGSTVGLWRVVGQAMFAVMVLLVVHGPGDVAGVPLAQLIGDSIAAVAMLVVLQRAGLRLPVVWRPDITRPVFRQARALVASILLGLTIYNSDIIFLWVFHDSWAVGLYAAAYLLVSFVLNIGIAYTTSLMPSLTRARNNTPERVRLYSQGVAHLFAGGLPIAIGGVLLAPQIIELVFGAPYRPAILPLQILLCTLPVSLVREVPVVALITYGHERSVLRLTAIATAANLALNLALIPRWGIVGAAVATLVTEVGRAALAVMAGGRLELPIPSLNRLWRALVAATLMAAVLSALPWPSVWVSVPLGAVVYVIGLHAVGGIRWLDGKPHLRI